MVGEGVIGVPAAVSGAVLEGAGVAGPVAGFCPTLLLIKAGDASAAGDKSDGAGAEEAGLVPADGTGGSRVLDAVEGESMLEAWLDSLEGVGDSMTGLLLVEADCKDVLGGNGMSGTSVFDDLVTSAGADAETAGLEVVGVLCTGVPEVSGLAVAIGTPFEAEVAGDGLSGELSVGVDAGVIGIIMPVTIDSKLIGVASLLLQEKVP